MLNPIEPQESIEWGIQLSEEFNSEVRNPHSLFLQWQKDYQELAVHYEWGTDPADLIRTYRPSETKFAFDYRLESYEQSTFWIAQKIITLQIGVFSNPQVYSVYYPNDDDRTIQNESGIKEYFNEIIPVENNRLESYYWEFLAKMILQDPNGFIAVMPELTDEQSDPDTFRKPRPIYIPSSAILDYGKDFVFVQSSDTMFVGSGDDTIEAKVYFYFTVDGIYKMIPSRIDGEDEVKYEASPHFIHTEYKKLDIRKIGGVIDRNPNSVLSSRPQVIHRSYLLPTLPALNRAVRYLSDLNALMVNAMHPIRYGIPKMCEECSGKCTTVVNEEVVNCPVCLGAGTVVPTTSPLEGYMVEPNLEGKIHAPVNFVSPDVSPFITAKEFYYETLFEAFQSLDIDHLKSSGQNQTARGKEIDREGYHSYLKSVSNTIYPILQWIFDISIQQRYENVIPQDEINNFRAIVVDPIHFDTTKFAEMMLELKEAIGHNFPIPTKKAIASKLMEKIFGSGTREASVNSLYMALDPLALLSDEERAIRLLEADATELAISQNIGIILETALEKQPDFVSLPLMDQRKLIKEIAISQFVNESASPKS